MAVPAALGLIVLVALNVVEARRAQERALLAAARAASAAVDIELVRQVEAAEALATADVVVGRGGGRGRARADRLRLGDDAWIVVSDASGRRLLNSFPGPRPAEARPYGLPRPRNIREALAAGGPRISNLFVGQASGRHVIAVDAPASDDAAQIVVSIVSTPERLLPILRRQSLPPAAFVTVVDREYRVIARSRSQARFVGKLATPNMIAAMRAAPDGVRFSRSLENEPTVVAYARSDISGWTTMVVVPRGVVEGPILLNATYISVILLVLAGVSLAAIRGQSRIITGELHALEADAVALGQGRTVALRQGRVSSFDTVQAALSAASDELERRAERQKLLINELNHRVKNTLATVQALAAQTFRGGDGMARAAFEARLSALAGAHDLLTQTAWTAVGMRDLVDRCLLRGETRIDAEGPQIILPPEAATALCMCLHELSTNALKYGALSSAAGRVEVRWGQVDEAVELTWREAGGPPVQVPTRRGFGGTLIDRLVRHELNGIVERTFDPAGLVVRLRFSPRPSGRWAREV
ncbi:MAG: sensor histidine kinase [Brevundimonas sp.]